MTFLQQTAQQILSDHPTDLHRILVLLPGKRSEVFLKRELSTLLQKPALAPAMQTIEDFVQNASGYQPLSQLQALMKLFGVYREKINKEETFDNFLKWGNTLLHDFNEVDRHLIDAKQLYSNLLDAKHIESWGVEPGNETDLMKNFLRFWRELYPLYQAFHALLDAENLSYQGKAYKKVAADLSLLNHALEGRYSGIYLIGFNALNTAEEHIFRHLISTYEATALWDADSYYLDNKQHEAGEFLRKYQQWPEFQHRPFTWRQSLLTSIAKKVEVISAPTKQGMAQATGNILQSLPAVEGGQTAVVLADESMLLPLLDSIPAQYEALNVTMGLPVKHAAVSQDMLAVLRMHEQAERTKLGGSSYSFHHRTFLAVVESSLFRKLAGKQETITAITEHVVKYNLVFLTPKKAAEVMGRFDDMPDELIQLFLLPESVLVLLQRLDAALLRYVERQEESDTLLAEAAFTLHQLHQQATSLLSEVAAEMENATLLRLYQSMLAEHQVDFFGEPLAGLQIMGMLETRTLDFKRIIITSLNEGILPSGKSQNSFIPYDLKIGFGLPTHNEKDAIYAYHFYRLIQRAEEVWLIYDSDTQGVGLKEKSRFILQMENELVHEKNISLLPTKHASPEVNADSLVKTPCYDKDEAVLMRLREIAEKGFSPSALAAYLKDPAQFYIDRLLKVDETDEVAETIGYDVLGNVVHKSLEELFTTLVGDTLDEESLKELLEQAPGMVQHYLATEYKGNLTEGRNLLTSKVALHMVEVAIKNDLSRLENGEVITLEALEKEMVFTTEVPGLDFPITFKGLADRIDHTGDGVLVLDYKTGMMDKKEITAESIGGIFESDQKTKAFQVLFYGWLYVKTFGFPVGELKAGIFSTRKPGEGIMYFGLGPARGKKEQNITENVLVDFEETLFGLVRELFEATKPFTQRLSITEET